MDIKNIRLTDRSPASALFNNLLHRSSNCNSAFKCLQFVHNMYLVVQWLISTLIIERFGIRFPGPAINFFQNLFFSLIIPVIHVHIVQSTVTVPVLEGMSSFQHLSEQDHRWSRGCACVRASSFRCSGFDSHSPPLPKIIRPNCIILC